MSDKATRKPKGRRTEPLTAARTADLPVPCVSCTFWELGPAARPTGQGASVKSDWVTQVEREWGPPGRIVTIDGVVAGYVVVAPPALVPRALAFPTAPVSDDALLLVTARVASGCEGHGIGRKLLHAVAKDGLHHGYRAIEAFARTGEQERSHCLLPEEFLTRHGWQVVREHPTTPRLRLDLRTVLTWADDVEHALGRAWHSLRGVSRPPAPAGGNGRVIEDQPR